MVHYLRGPKPPSERYLSTPELLSKILVFGHVSKHVLSRVKEWKESTNNKEYLYVGVSLVYPCAVNFFQDF